MNRARRSAILVFLVLLSAGVVVAMAAPDRFRNSETRGEITFQEDKGITSRAEIVNLALVQGDLFDCATYPTGGKSVLPAQQEIFAVVQNVQVTPKDGNGYLGAVWSPKGDAIVFVVSTSGRRDITNYVPYPSDSQTRPVAVGISKLLLYFPSRNTWEEITADGTRPVWSADGQSVYYIAGTNLMRFDLAVRKIIHTGKSAPNTGIGLLFSRPLADGRFLAPRGSEASLEVWESELPALRGIGVMASDQVLLSPRGDSAILAYSASMNQNQVIPAVTILRRSDGSVTPLLKNCQNSALKMVWSPSGDKIAYPLHADPPEIRIYDLRSNQTKVVFRNDVYDHLNNLSWSPDGKYLAFTRGDGRGSPAPIWVISTEGVVGQQLVPDGFLSNWSPDGKQILYVRQGAWYLMRVNPIMDTIGK